MCTVNIHFHKETEMNIYVGNLSYDISDEDLRMAFEDYGQVESAKVIKDKYNGQSKGFGFVEMPAKAEAEAAIKSLNDKELKGKSMSVSEARPRNESRGGGRGRGGGGSRGGGGGRGGWGGGGGGGGNRGNWGGGGRF